MNVRELSCRLGVWGRIEKAVRFAAASPKCDALLAEAGEVPVQPSRAVRTLGCYVSRGKRPLAIRLQFRQEPDVLIETLLHEVAHLLDHLLNYPGNRYRGAHGAGWRRMVDALGASPQVRGRSDALSQLRQSRLKLVAVCSGCGEPFHRLRRYPSGRRYVHRSCGAALRLL